MKIMNGDQVVAVVPFGTHLSRFYAERGIDEESASVELTPHEQRQETRKTLYQDVADLPTLVGVTADTAAICLDLLATLTAALDTAATLDELRDAVAPFQPHMTQLRDKLAAGSVKLPYRAKGGLAAVMPEIEAMGTQAASVFEGQ